MEYEIMKFKFHEELLILGPNTENYNSIKIIVNIIKYVYSKRLYIWIRSE